MAEIQVLSDVLANQIAAGEVIERPASVVKELVENAIDAQASQIDILVSEAGIASIRVVDNGQGIPAEQVARAFERHATSKITSRHDLFRIHSLGFRGEALPSIASVADVVLETATADAEQGAKIHYRGGVIETHTSGSARQGTDILVTDLFFNTPARLKYLKAKSTELSQIVDVLNRLAISHPDVAFRLTHDGKALLRTPGNGDLHQVLAEIYGIQQARKMLAFEAEDQDFKIKGYVSLPELTRANRSYMSTLINGRYIKNYQLTNAIIKGYGSKLMVGRFPIVVAQIEMDPLLVDVNVHPQKHEVRLSKEKELATLLTTTIQARLAEENLIPDAYQNMQADQTADKRADFISRLNAASVQARQSVEATPNVMPDTPAVDRPESPAVVETVVAATEMTVVPEPIEETPITVKKRDDLALHEVDDFVARYQAPVAAFSDEAPTPVFAADAQPLDLTEPETASTADGVDQPATQRFPGLTYIGQMHGTFLFAQGEEGLYMIDQHAAQERIKYEYYRAALGENTQTGQTMLVPLTLTYTLQESLQIEAKLAELAALGIELEPFGTHTYLVRSHPSWFIPGQEEATVREMIDWIFQDKTLTQAAFREKTAIMMACKRSIKANHALNPTEGQGLLDQLAQTENPYNCPHGRPTVVSFSLTDMEKMFKRIQDSHGDWTSYDDHPF